MKKLFAILTCVLLLCASIPLGAIPVLAATSGTTGDCTWTLDGTHLTISGNGAMGDYDYWDDPAPWGTEITSITIANGVTTIGEAAFYGCGSLTSVTIGDSVTTIGQFAFYQCIGLTSVTIPDSVTTIEYGAFSLCSFLTSVTIGNRVSRVESLAFNGCDSLTDVYYRGTEVERKYIEIGASSNHCLTDATWHYQPGITGDCTWVLDGTHLIISGKGAMKDYSDGFYNTAPWGTGLTSVTIEEGVTSIGAGSFNKCTSISSVSIGSGVTTIGKGAFRYCNKLQTMTIPDSVTVIEDLAFSWCTALTTFHIGAGPISIRGDAFNGCTAVTDVYYGGSEAEHKGGNWNRYFTNATWHYDDKPTIASGTTGDCSWTLDGTHLTISGNGAMGDYDAPWGKDITSVTIEDGVTTIGDYVFCECAALTSVTIPDSVTTISYSAFSCCSSLAEIAIPDSVTTIDDYAFDGCSSLTSVTIPDSVITIGDSAFYECSSLTSVTIGDGVTFIDDWAFYECDSLTSVYITDVAAWCAIDFSPTDANPIEYAHALYLDGVLITDLIIPDGVTSIGDYAFIGCNSLTEITIPDSVASIGNSAFSECSSLTSVTIDGGVTTIGSGTFSNCNSLTEITIPDSVTSIGKYAFNSCISLTDVFYSGGEAGRANITIDKGNTLLLNATWHYNYAPVCEHEYVGTITTPNTCGSAGVMTYTCSICGDSYTEELPAIGDHVYDNAFDDTCNVCGEKRPIDIPTDAPTFVVDDVTARAGDVFTVAVRTKNNSGIVSLKLKIGYDTDVLELISVAAGDFPAEGYTFGPTTKNPFTVIWLDATQPNNTTDGNVILLSFRVKEGAPVGQTDIVVSYNAEDVYDYDFNNVPFLIENGTVDIVDFRLGDINDDGYVNNKDLGILQRYLADLDVTVNLLAADVTADGHVNNKDLGRLQQYLADWDVELGK